MAHKTRPKKNKRNMKKKCGCKKTLLVNRILHVIIIVRVKILELIIYPIFSEHCYFKIKNKECTCTEETAQICDGRRDQHKGCVKYQDERNGIPKYVKAKNILDEFCCFPMLLGERSEPSCLQLDWARRLHYQIQRHKKRDKRACVVVVCLFVRSLWSPFFVFFLLW